MYLKYAYDLSDDDVVAAWVENPYWQFFTGGTFFEHRPPIDSYSLTNWRKRIGAAGAEQMLAETRQTGLKTKMIRLQDLKRVNVDTTVQEKEIGSRPMRGCIIVCWKCWSGWRSAMNSA